MSASDHVQRMRKESRSSLGIVVQVSVLYVFSGFLITNFAFAGAGDLDPTFGEGGMVSTDILAPTSSWVGRAVTVQADKKIVIVGGGPAKFFVARLNADGSSDETFGTNGKTTLDFGSWNDGAWAVTTQPDGKIVVGGITKERGGGKNGDTVLVRYNQDGTRDHTFGTDGYVITDFGYFTDEHTLELIKDIHVQADGRILALGSATSIDNTVQGAAIVAYRSNGDIDSSWGHLGRFFFSTAELGLRRELPLKYKVQFNGRILVLFSAYAPNDRTYSSVWVGIKSDGHLDASFGNDGITVVPDFDAKDMDIDGTNNILVRGTNSHYERFLVRINSNGYLDSTFGTNGFVTFPNTGLSFYYLVDMAVAQDGRIIFLGSESGSELSSDASYTWQWQDIGAFALTAHGELDQGFGANGEMIFPFDTIERKATPKQVIRLDNERVVILTEFDHFPEGVYLPGKTSIAVAVINNDGAPDQSFGSEGRSVFEISIEGANDGALASEMQASGKTIVSGQARGYGLDILLARYLEDGSLDSTFGTDGYVITDLRTERTPQPDNYYGTPSITEYDDVSQSIAIQADGKIVVGGYSQEFSYYDPLSYTSFAIARYFEDGALDNSFGDNGKAIIDFYPDVDFPPFAKINDILIQPDGKIIAVGYARNRPGGGPYEFSIAVARLNADGSPDNTFGTEGKTWLHSGNIVDLDGYYSFANAVALRHDGKIVVGGNYKQRQYWYDDGGFLIIQINDNGTLDTSFGSGGLVKKDIDNGLFSPDVDASSFSADDLIKDLVIRPDGKILAGGSAFMGETNDDMVLAQFNENGTSDIHFGTGGVHVLDYNKDLRGVLPLGADEIEAIKLQDDGRIIAGGYSGRYKQLPRGGRLWKHSYNLLYGMTVMRFEPDGWLDYSFGEGGRVTIDFDQSQYSFVQGLNVQANGQIVAAGYVGYPYNIYSCFSADIAECPSGAMGEVRSNIALARLDGTSTQVDVIEALIWQIQDLSKHDLIISGAAKSLMAKLTAALQQLDRHNVNAATRQLGAFVSQINVLISRGAIPQQKGSSLAYEAEELIALLST